MAKKKKTKKEDKPEDILQEFTQHGLHFGHKKSKWHPAMEPYIYGLRGGVHIIDLEKTKEKLEEARQYLKKLASEGKNILFVGTALSLKNVIKGTAEEVDMPYVKERWIGGTLTNFDVIKERLEGYRDLEKRKEKGELKKYPKVEQREFDRELERLEQKWGGVKNLESIPDCLFITDYEKDNLAVREARKKGIPVVGICDTNANPEKIDYPIPANDDAIQSVSYILGKAKEAIKEGLAEEDSKEE